MINDLIEISKRAGELIKEGFGKSLEVNYKTNEINLVTQIDKASEKLIIDFIKNKFPSHSILAEEGGGVNNDSEYLWVVDPLDGTTNFTHGLPIFAVSIGVQKNNKTIAGVVFDVMRDVIYSAELGSGAFANSIKLNVTNTEKLNHSLLVTGFPYNIAENPDHAFERFVALTKKSRGVRRLGSAAIDFCYLASGVFDGFWEVNLQPWDICAGKLIVEEAGGLVTDFEGKHIDIYSKKILCTNNNLHNKIIDVMNEISY
ncbi:MAG: inositol monophosphatase family protein [Ignavibacteria bacterium]|nr:MAG: inositol monophosphatase family protein [Ignavibacteria bacterium]